MGDEADKSVSEDSAPEAEEPQEAERGDRRKAKIFLAVLLVMIAAYIATFLTLSLLRYYNFRGSEFDTAIFNQVVWLLSRFKAPISTIRGMNLYGDHMAPNLFFLAPLYWIGGRAPALLISQTVAIGVGAIPIYLLGVRKLDSRWVALGIAAAYLLYPAVQHVNLADFHPESLGLMFLLFAFLAIDKRKFAWFYVMCVLAAFCKEDMVLAVLLLGIIVYFLYDKRAGLIVSAVSAVYFLLSVLIFIPRLAPAGYQYSGRLKSFGNTTGEAVKNFFLKPRRTVSIIATRQNLKYIFDLLMPVAFLSLFAPVFLLPALPAFFFNIISDFAPQHTIGGQYTAAIIPFVFIAAIFGMKRFRKWSEGAFRAKYVLGGIALVLLACAIAGNFYWSPSPLSAGFRPADFGSDKHITAIREGMELIDPDASVSAQTYMLAHLSSREKIYQFPEPFRYLVDKKSYSDLGKMLNTSQEDAKKIIFPKTYRLSDEGRSLAPRYVMLDSGSHYAISKEMYEALVRRLEAEGAYRTIYSNDGVKVLEKV